MKEKQINIRVDQEDLRILDALHKKLGLPNAGIFRLAIRRLMEHEGIKLKTSK